MTCWRRPPAGSCHAVFGNAIGFVFAVVAFTISAVSFPLLLDRDVGAAVALSTSIRAVAKNPLTMAAWGAIIAALLFVGSLPFFLGFDPPSWTRRKPRTSRNRRCTPRSGEALRRRFRDAAVRPCCAPGCGEY